MAVDDERQALVALLEGEPDGALGSRIVNRMLRFAHELRGAGLVADPASVIEFARAMLAVGPTDREAVRAAGAVVFARSPEQVGRYEAIFDRFWRRGEEQRDASDYAPANASDREEEPEPSQGDEERAQRQPQEVEGSVGAGAEAAERAEPGASDEEAEDESAAADASWSHLDVLRTRSFDQMSPEELREAALLVDRLRPALAMRRTRRVRLHDRGDTLAPRAMLRRSLSTGGDLLYWRWRRPVVRTRPVIILCDISGSMERYSRLLLRFSHALMQSDVPVEAFAFGTRLTRVTRELRRRNADAALEAASQAVHDWSGGTDIGRSLKTFNRLWGRRLPLGRSVVLIISDGWDRGSADVVAGETAWLQRSCHRLIWLNPLAGTPGYEPLTAGMAAALPHVDRFLACDSIADLEALGELLAANALEPIPAPISPLASPEPARPAARG
jgi:uncharacterized protein with von Willebrand factor type A (vWA) domain